MEIDGHPTQDLIEELERRGALRAEGSSEGPRPDTLSSISDQFGNASGVWLFCPRETFLTGLDEVPS